MIVFIIDFDCICHGFSSEFSSQDLPAGQAAPSRRVSVMGDSADHPIELPSTPEPSELEHSEPAHSEPEQSEPSDDEEPLALPSDQAEIAAAFAVDWSGPVLSDDEQQEESSHSDPDEIAGFANEQPRDANAVAVAFGSRRGRRPRWGNRGNRRARRR